jgi:hypothetical protein
MVGTGLWVYLDDDDDDDDDDDVSVCKQRSFPQTAATNASYNAEM